MNHFFALTLPSEVRQQIAEHSRRWRELLGPEFPARWHEPEDYHITLKFLGDVGASRHEELVAAAAPVAAATGPFRVLVTGSGFFPSPRLVHGLLRHVYADEAMRTLQQQIETVMQDCGFPGEKRPFRPHVTLARCKRRERGSVPAALEDDEQMFVNFPVNHFVLMQTTPPEARQKNRPVRYNTVHTFPLGDTHS